MVKPLVNVYDGNPSKVILALSELLGGFTFSLLSPFYTKEAVAKGISVTETGLVYGSVFATSIVCSPIFGKYIEVIGSRYNK